MIFVDYKLNGWFLPDNGEPRALLKLAMQQCGYWDGCELEDSDIASLNYYIIENELGVILKDAYELTVCQDESQMEAVISFIVNVIQSTK